MLRCVIGGNVGWAMSHVRKGCRGTRRRVKRRKVRGRNRPAYLNRGGSLGNVMSRSARDIRFGELSTTMRMRSNDATNELRSVRCVR